MDDLPERLDDCEGDRDGGWQGDLEAGWEGDLEDGWRMDKDLEGFLSICSALLNISAPYSSSTLRLQKQDIKKLRIFSSSELKKVFL